MKWPLLLLFAELVNCIFTEKKTNNGVVAATAVQMYGFFYSIILLSLDKMGDIYFYGKQDNAFTISYSELPSNNL